MIVTTIKEHWLGLVGSPSVLTFVQPISGWVDFSNLSDQIIVHTLQNPTDSQVSPSST